MKLNVQPSGDVAVVTVQAEFLDGGNAKLFKEQITPICEQYHKVVLDLGPVQFVDSTGCGAILTCLKQLSAAKGDLKLCRIARPVQALFDLVRIQRILECYATPEEAVKSFAAAE